MKRGQFEIMGLAIVMVIVSIGVFFLISISLSDDNSDPASEFLQDQFAQNILRAYMTSTHPDAECAADRKEVTDFFVSNITNEGPAECRDHETWEKLEEELDTAIKGYVGRDYYFSVREDICSGPFSCEKDGIKEVFRAGTCDPQVQRTGRAGQLTPSKYPQGNIQVVLWLCDPQ